MPRFYSNNLLRRGLSQYSSRPKAAATTKKADDAKPAPAPKVKPYGKKGETRTILPKRPRGYPDIDAPLPRKHKPSKPHGKPSLRKSIRPGTILIVLAGRYKSKRVVFLKQLDSGLLLITGPFRLNGVPLRRINQRYVIATRTKVKLGADFKLDPKFNDRYFKLNQRDKKDQKARRDAIRKKTNELKGKHAEGKKADKEAKKAAAAAAKEAQETPKASGAKGKKAAAKKDAKKPSKVPKSMWDLKRNGRRLGGTILPTTRKDDQKAVDTLVIKAIRKQDPLLRGYLKARFSLRKGQYPHAMKF